MIFDVVCILLGDTSTSDRSVQHPKCYSGPVDSCNPSTGCSGACRHKVDAELDKEVYQQGAEEIELR